MKTNSTVHKFLAVLLTCCLALPVTAVTAFADNKSGKKSYKEGLKHEESQQWELAAQEFALAVAADPQNAEYKLHYARSLQNASLMFTKRGDELAKQGDYASAYNAFRQALGYDPGNEMASLKMRSMIAIQKDQVNGLGQFKYDDRTGNLKPVSNEVKVASKPRSRDIPQDITFKDTEFKDCVKTLARTLDLNVLFDESVRTQGKVNFELRGITMAKAFDLLLMQNKMTFEEVARKTIMVYADNQQTRQKYERAAVKTFYLGNIKINDARQVLNSLIPGRPVGTLEGQNAVILKGTPSELQLVQDILESVDKNISEVVIDVEIYEVSNDTKLQIGNQLASDKGLTVQGSYVDKATGETKFYTAGETSSLANLGGIARGAVALAGTTFNPFSGVGGLIGLPATTISLLQSKGHSRLLNKIQIHALDNQPNNTKVGRSVPVSLGQNYGNGGYGGAGGLGGIPGQQGGVNPTLGGALNGFGASGYGGGLFNNIQYKDVGLVIDATPKITNEGYVELKMKIETSDVQAGADPLTPNFTQRSLSTTARIQDGVTSIVASVTQDSKGDSRTSIPVVGMLPFLGRLFTTPKQDTHQTDIIITVTPHIIRPTEITKEDNLAHLAGALTAAGQGSGLPTSIEDVINRAVEDDEQERRLIAQERGLPADPAANTPLQTSAQIAPVSAPNASNGAGARNANAPLPDNGLPAGPSGTANTFQTVGNSETKPPRKQLVIQGDPNSPSSSSQNYNQPPVQADVTVPPPVEPNPVVPNPATLNNGGANPTLTSEAANAMIPGSVVNPTFPGGAANPNGAIQPVGEVVGPNGIAGVIPGQPQTGGVNPAGVSENAQPQVKPAQVVGAVRPPHVEKWIQEEQLRILKEKEAAKKASKQPATRTPDPAGVASAPQGNVQRAVLTPVPSGTGASGSFEQPGAPTPMRIEAPKAGTLALSLNAAASRVQMNRLVAVTLQVDAQSVLTSATLALRFDPAKLQVKSVRDGDMLGKQADITHTVENGLLVVNAGAGGGKAAKAAGRLLVIEFTAVGEGQAQIAIERGESQIKLTNNALAVITATPAQLTIVR